jgi:hypothetical protein
MSGKSSGRQLSAQGYWLGRTRLVIQAEETRNLTLDLVREEK